MKINKQEELKARLVGFLKLSNSKNLNNRIFWFCKFAGIDIHDIFNTCPRCGGTGEFSYNAITGTRCFQCQGDTVVPPTTLKGWKKIEEMILQAQNDGVLQAYFVHLEEQRVKKAQIKKLADMQNELFKASPLNIFYENNWNKGIKGFHEVIYPIQKKRMDALKVFTDVEFIAKYPSKHRATPTPQDILNAWEVFVEAFCETEVEFGKLNLEMFEWKKS